MKKRINLLFSIFGIGYYRGKFCVGVSLGIFDNIYLKINLGSNFEMKKKNICIVRRLSVYLMIIDKVNSFFRMINS